MALPGPAEAGQRAPTATFPSLPEPEVLAGGMGLKLDIDGA